MEVLDAQVHLWTMNASRRALGETILNQVDDAVKNSIWEFFQNNSLTASQFVREMDMANVAGALIVTPALYRDNSYSLSACHAYPRRYRVVGSVDPTRPDVEDLMVDWAKRPGMVGVRIMALNAETQSALDSGAYDALLRGARKGPLTVCILAPYHPGIAKIAQRFDDVQFVVDHLGILPDPLGPSSFPLKRLWQTIEPLVSLKNVSLKLGNIPALSDEEAPFPDVWPHVCQILCAFGPQRVMWASDHSWYLQHLPYRAHVDLVRENTQLSVSDREWLLAGALRRAFRWPVGQA